MAEIDISFCLPVYNIKAYLEECIESIRAQGLDRYEIVCVDDCSTDGTWEVEQRLAKKYPEIRVLRNEKNSGVSHSRNRALREARGRYIWFVDPDDLLTSGAAKCLLGVAEEYGADVVLGDDYFFLDGDGIPEVEQGTGEVRRMDYTDLWGFHIHNQKGDTSLGVWAGIFRREFLLDNDLLFREDMEVWEDFVFDFEVGMKHANAFGVDFFSYLHRSRKVSLSHGNDKERAMEYYSACLTAVRVIREYRAKADPAYYRAIDAHMQEAQDFIIFILVHKTDRSFVKREMKALRADGLYPYRHRRELEFDKHDLRDRFVKIVLNTPLFHLLNLYVCAREKATDRRRERA